MSELFWLVVILGIVALIIQYFVNKIKNRPEVYHISENKYEWKNAEDVCKKYNARLATEQEVADAWKNGAEWCNYGWTEGGKAYFAVQKNTPNCDKEAGLHGGEFYKEIELGVNCFGVKPKIQPDIYDMPPKITQPVKPKQPFEREIDNWNRDKWSQFQ